MAGRKGRKKGNRVSKMGTHPESNSWPYNCRERGRAVVTSFVVREGARTIPGV